MHSTSAASKTTDACAERIPIGMQPTPPQRIYPRRKRVCRFHIITDNEGQPTESHVSSPPNHQFENMISMVRCGDNRQERYKVEQISRVTKILLKLEAKDLVGQPLFHWCSRRPKKVLDDETALRYRLYDEEVGEWWSVYDVMYVEHNRVHQGERGVRILSEPAYYVRNRDEPQGAWSQMQLHSIAGPGLTAALKAQDIWRGLLKCRLQQSRETIALVPQDDFSAINSLDRYCLQNPTLPVLVSTPEHRPHFEITVKHRLEGEIMMVSNTVYFCLQASLMNGVKMLAGERYGKLGMMATDLLALVNFAEASQWLRQNSSAVSLVHINRRLLGTDWISWTAKQTSGVYLMRLRARNFDHVICIEADKQQVLDAVEPCPLKLSAETIRSCAGKETTDLRVMEIRRVRYLGSFVSGRKRKRKSQNNCLDKRAGYFSDLLNNRKAHISSFKNHLILFNTGLRL